MTDQPVEVAILIVCYNGRNYLQACLTSVLDSVDPGIHSHVVVVDNASTDDSRAFLKTSFPEVDCVASATNLGFAGGNNLGWDHIQARYPHAQYLVLLNQDVRVESGWLAPLVQALQSDPAVGCVQPKILLDPRTDHINTVGNRSHFLGFGFTTGYLEEDRGQYDQPASIDFASGAALVVRTELLEQVGLFDPLLFMYLEDAELGWKLRLLGRDIRYVPTSRVFHQYQFNRNFTWYYFLERNRLWLMATYYRWPTLVLLAPAIAVMELGQLLFAATVGRTRDKLRSWGFFLSPANLRRLRAHRHTVQSGRLCGDRHFVTRFTGRIDSPELKNPLIRWVANPLLNTYWQVVRRLIIW